MAGKFCPGCRGSGNVRIIVHYERIAAAFTDRGMFAPEIHELADLHLKLAKQFSPARTGRMRREHYRWIEPAKGYTRKYSVGTRARYANFVLGGTKGNGTGLIFAKDGGELELRPMPYSYFKASDEGRFRESVHGQAAQENWLKTAGSEALAYFGLGKSRFTNAVSRPKSR